MLTLDIINLTQAISGQFVELSASFKRPFIKKNVLTRRRSAAHAGFFLCCLVIFPELGVNLYSQALAMDHVEPAIIVDETGNLKFTEGLKIGQITKNGLILKPYSIDMQDSTSFWADDPVPARVNRIVDRLLVGAAVKYTGRRNAPLGGSWLTENGANYFEKNSQAVILGTNMAGLTVGSFTDTGQGSNVNAGLMAVSVNQGNKSFGRAGYFEAFHKGQAAATTAIELQVGNYTAVDPTPNSYAASGVATALYIGAESGSGYKLGDDNRAAPTPRYASAEAIDISGGSKGAAYQRFKVGINFRNASLYRGLDGINGKAVAISFAKEHEIRWQASASILGAVIRSDVNAVPGRDVGLIFSDSQAKISGAGERTISVFRDDSFGTGAVNWVQISNSRTNMPVKIAADGTDAAVAFELQTKGRAIVRFLSHAGQGENFRITPPIEVPVNFLNLSGSQSGAPVTIEAAGQDKDLDIIFVPKGAGEVRFGAFTPSKGSVNTGYILIKTADGKIRKLAVIE